ncbi:hypothetical protein [Paenarthrobacter nitroguajacolicus]
MTNEPPASSSPSTRQNPWARRSATLPCHDCGPYQGPRLTSITIRDGIYVTDTTYSPYDTVRGDITALPLSNTESSQINAEFIYRGSTIEPPNQITLPPATRKQEDAAAVEH